MVEVKSKKSRYGIIVLVLISMLCVFYPSDKAFATFTMDVNHRYIGIDFFYHGDRVNVSGTIEQGIDIITTITSLEGHQSLKKKGKVGGLLWMNIGTLNFKKVFSLYLLTGTKKIEDILNREEMNKYLIGYEALENHAEITPVSDGQEKAKWFADFVKLQKAAKLYEVSPGRITLKQGVNGSQTYYVPNNWPYQAVPGTYLVTVYAVKDGKVVEKAEKNLFVEQVGMIKFFANMAKNKGALYGIISIVVALFAGFGVGIIFRKGGAH